MNSLCGHVAVWSFRKMTASKAQQNELIQRMAQRELTGCEKMLFRNVRRAACSHEYYCALRDDSRWHSIRRSGSVLIPAPKRSKSFYRIASVSCTLASSTPAADLAELNSPKLHKADHHELGPTTMCKKFR
jgi:hypothetical protein